ncbi:MAG: nucleotidyltransferase domain-containing protein [Clostridium sp.]|uniref:nucleotidyltransferase domain-containing protein n=1 Tax=Clostridium sp. TaxID=1506 RepID=UPI003D6CE7A9
MDISYFLNSVEEWVNHNEDIKSLILVGSYVRGESRVDSDVDLVMITTNPDLYINNCFADNFGKVINSQKENWGRVTSIRVWYDNNALEVEFGITTPIWIESPLDVGTFRVLSDGYKVIVDKENYFKNIILSQ